MKKKRRALTLYFLCFAVSSCSSNAFNQCEYLDRKAENTPQKHSFYYFGEARSFPLNQKKTEPTAREATLLKISFDPKQRNLVQLVCFQDGTMNTSAVLKR